MSQLSHTAPVAGTFTKPGTKAIPAGAFALTYNRSYSEKFPPKNGTYTADMNGRLYINVLGLGHFRSTRVVSGVTVTNTAGVRKITSIDWSTNPADANALAAGDVSKSLEKQGFIGEDPRTATFPNYDEDGQVESTSPMWEACDNPDPLAVAQADASVLGM